jgi:hypothetical protein
MMVRLQSIVYCHRSSIVAIHCVTIRCTKNDTSIVPLVYTQWHNQLASKNLKRREHSLLAGKNLKEVSVRVRMHPRSHVQLLQRTRG